MAASASSPERGPNALISGRYRLQAELGRGGMGAVHRAFDEATSRTLALKMLESADRRMVGLFEREYHTLASLRHPRVIEVYDFGIAANGRRYYTMELLAGSDLASLSPLPFVAAAAHLRDVATSLALLHARRLVHRDVSPRNIRLDDSGRAKLLDFGALTGFGAAREIVGTPPFMAPEVLRRLSLDQRSDLFSLGAVAYHALTKRLPFAIRTMQDAEQAYRTAPPPPSHFAPDVPKALDGLVLSLLSLDPLGRPSSAAEVIDRLSAVAELDREPLTGVAESHLLSSALVGREREKRQLSTHLGRTQRGAGSVVVVESVPGMGRSRLGSELALDARIAGVTTLRVDVLEHPSEGEALRALALSLLESAPTEAGATLRTHAAQLVHAFPELTRHLAEEQCGAVPPLPAQRAERRASIQGAFARWLVALAEQRPTVLFIDDAHALDSDTAGALVMAAHAAQRARLMIVLSVQLEAPGVAAVQQLTRNAARLRLRPLNEEQVGRLVASAFGDVPHRVRLSQWLTQASGGNPGHALALLQHLVARGLVRYERGAWSLPAELPEQELPRGLEEALAARLAQLSPAALELTRLLALYQGALPLRACLRLAPGVDDGETVRNLDQLVAQDLLLRGAESYRFGPVALRELVLESCHGEARRALHRTLASALSQLHQESFAAVRDGRASTLSTAELGMVLQVATHLERSGDEEAGRRLMREAAVELTVRGDGLGEAVPALEAAVARLKAEGRPNYELLPLLVPLALAGTYHDFRLSYRYGEETLNLLLDLSGISLAARLRRMVGGTIALWLGLGFALVRFWFVARHAIRSGFRDVLLGVIGIGSALLGTYSVLLDEARARRVLERTDMLRFFPARHPVRVVRTLQLALYDASRGDSAGSSRQAMAALSALGAVRALRDEARLQLLVGCLTPVSLGYSQRVDGRIHAVFEALDRREVSVSRQIAAGGRAVYHGHRGERAKFVRYHEEMDVLASRAGSTWREDVGTPRQMWSSYALCEDVMGLKRCAEELSGVADDKPLLGRVRDAARACYLAERGMHREALARHGAMFELAVGDGTLMGSRFAGAYARILRAAGQHERARDVCQRALSALSPEALEFTLAVIGAQLELSLAHAALGDTERALRLLDGMQAAHGMHDNPLVHGLMHKARAQVALLERDEIGVGKHFSEMERWFRKTDNPALVAQCQRLAKEARAASLLDELPRSVSDASSSSAISAALRACRSAAELREAALEFVIGQTGAERGYLYLLEAGALRCAAPREGPQPSEAWRQALELELQQQPAPDAVADTTGMTWSVPDDPAASFLTVPLVLRGEATPVVVGALALVAGVAPLALLEPRVLDTLTRALYAADDFAVGVLDAPPELVQTLRARPQPSNENGTVS